MAFVEGLTVFADPLARIFDDPDHSTDETREIIIGHSDGVVHGAGGQVPDYRCAERDEARATGL